VARPDRHRDPLPTAIPRPHRQPRVAAGVRNAEPHHQEMRQLLTRRDSSRSRHRCTRSRAARRRVLS
jgi:hypothetical protein